MDEKFQKLNDKLINHYQCFNTERFYLDDLDNDYVSIVSSIEDTCPIKLCRNIATFILRTTKKMKMDVRFIYVGAWAFDTEKMKG